MPRDERRAAIVDATLPLLELHGPAITTRQIAEAADVAEGTIFRAFDSLQDVIDAAILRAVSAERMGRMLDEQEFPGGLESDTAAALDVAIRYHDRIRAIIHIGHGRPGQCAVLAREELTDRFHEMQARLTERFVPHADALTISPAQFARYILVLAPGQSIPGDLDVRPLGLDSLVHLALHGARKEAR